MLDALRISDPVEAEAHFLRLIQASTEGPGVVVIDPGRAQSILAAQYRTDRDWAAEREHCPERRLAQWTEGPPTPEMVRALGQVAGLSGAEASRLVGVSGGRTWRKWVGGEREMPPAAYWWLLVVTGLHPEYTGAVSTMRLEDYDGTAADLAAAEIAIVTTTAEEYTGTRTVDALRRTLEQNPVAHLTIDGEAFR